MVVALMITAAATMGFAAWATLVAQRKQAVEQSFGGTVRRLAVENGRQIARQMAYTDFLSKNTAPAVSATNVEAGTNQIIGGVNSPGRTGFALESASYPPGFNRLSPAGLGFAYGVITNVTLPYSVVDAHPSLTVMEDSSTTLTAAMKSRSPLLSGDILVVHQPTLATTAPVAAPAITGNLDVIGGRAVYLTPATLANFSSVRASAVTMPTYAVPATNASQTRDPNTNTPILPSNFPSLLTSMGSVVAGNLLDASNRLNVIDSPNNLSNSFKEKIKAGSSVTIPTSADFSQSGASYVAATGVLTLDLGNQALPSVILENDVTEIILTGQANSAEESLADIYSSVGLCYIEDSNVSVRSLAKITCQNPGNKRRLIMGIKKIPKTGDPQVPGAAVSLSFTHSHMAPVWRLLVVAENTPLAFSAAGGAGTITLQGGLQTDGSIASTSGAGNSVRLIPEFDPRRLSRLAPRRGWVETYLDFTNGNL